MKVLRRRLSFRRAMFERLERRRVLAGGEIQLGPQTDIFDQPYVQVELRDGSTVIGPTGGDEFGVFPYNRLLLDTGANGIIAVNDTVTDMEANGYVTEGAYEEAGVSGTSYFDVSAPYEFRYWGTDSVVHSLPQTADDVRIMSNSTMNFGAPASEGGIPGIAGMPLMAGRVTTFDMGPWTETTDLFDLPPLGVTFADDMPPDSGHRYSVVADTRTVFDPHDGLPEGSPPDAPLPSWAPITFFDATPEFQGTSVTGGFLLDTGAQLSMISTQMAFDLGLDENGNGDFFDEAVDTLPIIGVGGTVDIPLLVIDQLSIPTEQGTQITFGAGSGEDDYIVVAVHDVAPGIDGIFGADLLTSGLEVDLESQDFQLIGGPYFTQVSLDYRNLLTQGDGRIYFDVNPLYDVEVPLNAAPELTIAGSASYTENAAAALLVTQASVADSDSPDFDTGTVTAAITVNVAPTDLLEIIPGDGFTLDGESISFNGTQIGTFSGGTGTDPLVVTLNANATADTASALIQRIGYRSTSDQPPTQTRTVEFRVTDGDGGESNAPTESVEVTAVNDAPLLDNSLSPVLTTIKEDALSPASTLVSSLLSGAVTDADANALRGIAVTTASSAVGTWQFSLNGGATWQPMGTPSEADARLLPGWARVRLIPKADFNGTVRLYYRAWDQTEGSSGGSFDLREHTGDSYAFSVAKESAALTVTPVNDPPKLSFSGTLNYVHDSPSVILAPFATVADVDSWNFGGGRLRVRIDQPDLSNRLLIGSAFTLDANNNVLLNDVIIGKRTSNGWGTNELVVTFNTKATKSIVQQLVRAIAFKTVGGSAGTRTIYFSVSDGDGGVSPEVGKTVNVT
jgi:hypothetical protein